MKIDLHVHTIKTKKGDGVSRNVKPEVFKNQLIDSGVGLAAITNHNIFNDEQFEKLRDNAYTLLPGIEIDFLENGNGKRSQMNVIFSNENIESAKKLSIFLRDKKVSYKNPISIDCLWREIKDQDVIIFVDNKNGKTKMTKECYEYIQKRNIKRIPILHDANNTRTHRILMSNNINSLIGSDVQSWENNKYVNEDSLDLIESQWPISNFKIFVSLLKTGRPIKDWLLKFDNKKFELKINGDDVKIEILSPGINIIIGDKATGKSEILNGIKEKLPRDNTSYFSEDYKKSEYKKLTDSREKIMHENIVIENQIKEKINEVINIEKDKSNSPRDFKNNILSPNNTKWKIQDSPIDQTWEPNFNYLSEFLKRINEVIDYLIKNKANLFLSEEKNKGFIQKITNIKFDVIRSFVKKELKVISSSISNKLKTEIRKVVTELKGIKSKLLSVGLISLYNYKKKIETEIDYVKSISLRKEMEIILDEKVPTIKRFIIVDKNYLIPFNKKIKLNRINSCKHIIKELSEAIKIFHSFSFENLDKFKEYWNDENLEKGIVSTERLILNEREEKIKLSSGQESILLLAQALKKDSDYIILDEPSSRIGSNALMEYVNEKIMNLRRSGKTIVIATHNSSLGINSLPNKFILREKNENGGYETLWSYIYGDSFIDKDGNKRNKFDFNDVVINLLEGGKKSYETRKEIYESKIND